MVSILGILDHTARKTYQSRSPNSNLVRHCEGYLVRKAGAVLARLDDMPSVVNPAAVSLFSDESPRIDSGEIDISIWY